MSETGFSLLKEDDGKKRRSPELVWPVPETDSEVHRP
jgi:hypothetical protein